MTSRIVLLAVTLISVVALTSGSPRHKRQTSRGPLYDYVHADDGVFSWTKYDEIQQSGFKTYFLNVTSQKWYDETLTDKPLWWHYVVVHIPDSVRFIDAGMLYISSGSNDNNPPTITDSHVFRMGQFANSTGIVAGVVRFIPNQPIIFENDGVGRYEDDFIAWTWRRFYNESHVGIDNPEILARMPMCKGSVRAMDAIQELVKGETGEDIEKFMVAGESKRGWTTWLTAAVDERVVAAAPVVLSCLNMQQNFHHYWKSLGGWSFALYDYWMHGVMGLIDEPEMKLMADIIDPYSYREWLTMPKLIISGASDEFFMPDDYDYFYRDLLGETKIWIVENSGHGVAGSPSGEDYWAMLQTFYLSVLQSNTMPFMDWSKTTTETSGTIVLLSPTAPLTIQAWSAHSVESSFNRRDFRQYQLVGMDPAPTGVVWVASDVETLGNGYYRATFDNPAEGYFAFFIKVTYEGPGGRIFHFTTEANIIPNTFPFEDCEGMSCTGTLV